MPRGFAQLGGLTGNLPFEIVELADPIQRLPRDLRPGGLPDIVDVTAQMRPAGRFPELAAAVCTRLVELVNADIGVHLKNAAAVLKVLL